MISKIRSFFELNWLLPYWPPNPFEVLAIYFRINKQEEIMAFSKAEVLHSLNEKLAMALSACNFRMWPYSAYLRWRVKSGHRQRVNEIEIVYRNHGWK